MMTKQRLKMCLETVKSVHGDEEAKALQDYINNLEEVVDAAIELQSVTNDEHWSASELAEAKDELADALVKVPNLYLN
jgi:hypothetical protein